MIPFLSSGPSLSNKDDIMGKVKYSNNGVTHLTQRYTPGDGFIEVASYGHFPVIGGGDYMFLSLGIEVFKVVEHDPTNHHRYILDPAKAPTKTYEKETIVELRMTKELLDAAGDMGEY
jgi:hypothetical protein